MWLNHAYEFSENKVHKKFIWDIKCSSNYDLYLVQSQKKKNQTQDVLKE